MEQSEKLMLTCSHCGCQCFFSGEQVSQDQQSDTYIIKMADNQAYCLNCMEHIIKQQMQQVRVIEERFIYFKQYQSSIQQRQYLKSRINEQGSEADQEQIAILTAEQAQLDDRIKQIKERQSNLKEKILTIEIQQQKYWQTLNQIERRTNKVQQKSLNTKHDRNQSQDTLDQLSKMSVIHLFAKIHVDDNVGYVQGMPIGKKTENSDIAWQQVAAGLGHLLIILNLLVRKYSYEYKRIISVTLLGSQSELKLKGRNRNYYLLYSRQNQKMFGEMLQVLLYELYHLTQYILEVERVEYSEQFKLPFAINLSEMKIIDLPIDPLRIQQRSRWSSWTKVMRYFLINFKHILTVYSIKDKYL